MKQSIWFLFISLFFLNISGVNAQDSQWEVDRIAQIREARQQELDSVLRHYKGRWEIEVGYGPWFFNPGARSTEAELFFFPTRMTSWEIGLSWHWSERFFSHLALGIQLHKDEPNPNISTILAGGTLTLEGSGGVFLPLEVGTSYYLREGRLRPFVGLSAGFLRANGQYIQAEGDLNTGINTTTVETRGQALTARLETGVDYRLGRNAQASLSASYRGSTAFEAPVGGYTALNGFALRFGLSLVL